MVHRVTPGSIVIVDWRDALLSSGEPNKVRPSIVIGRGDLYGASFAYLLVVPMSTSENLVVRGASLSIDPTSENMCAKRCFALTWNVQTVPLARIRETAARVTSAQLSALRDQVANLVER